MLISISCKNFKSIKETESISFDCVNDSRLDDTRLYHIPDNEKYSLIKTLAIIGPNGAGKSSMVKALAAMKAIVTEEDDTHNPLVHLQNGSFQYGDTKGQPSIISVDFLTEKNEIVRYRLVVSSERIFSETLYKTVKIDENSDGVKKMVYSRKFSTKIGKYRCSFGKIYEGEERRELTYRLPANRTVLQRAASLGLDFFSDVYSWFKDVLDIKPMGFATATENYLARMLSENPTWGPKLVNFLWACDITDIKEIRLKDGKPMFVHSNVTQKYGGYFTGESYSLRRLVTIGASLFESYKTNKVMVFDDFGMMLHPLVVQHAARLFEECSKTNKSQLMVVDCNPSLLKDGLLRRDGVYFAEKTAEGSTHYFSLADFRYSVKRLDSTRDYMNGAFGALPLVSEYKFDK